MHFGLIFIAILICLRGTSQRSRNCGESCHETTDDSDSCDDSTDASSDTDTDGYYSDQSNNERDNRKVDNFVLVPYPIPIVVPPAAPMQMLPSYIPVSMCGSTMCNETTETTTTTETPTTMSTTTTTTLKSNKRIDCAGVAQCSDRQYSRKSVPYSENVPNWMLKYGILPLPDTLALDLVNKMDEIQRRNETREAPTDSPPYLPVRKVDQSIYKMNNAYESIAPPNEVVEELRNLFTPKQDKYSENNYDSNEIDIFSLMKTLNEPRYN